MEIRGSNLLMMGRRVVFAEIIGAVEAALLPIDVKVALADAVTNPVKSHVNCFRMFLFDGVVGNTGSSTVVSLNGSRRLRMSKFFKANTDRAGLFAVEVDGSELSFSGTG
jgi:hypothetical protein